jgi:hypothetical protein
MSASFRTTGFFTLILLACSTYVSAQDMPARVEAIRLLERANAVSLLANPPNYKQEETFRSFGLGGTSKDGRFIGIFGRDSDWEEFVFGDYHMIQLAFPNRLVQSEYQPSPPETIEMEKLVPILVGRFDESDIIHSITPATLFGREAKCIQFETVNGRTRQSNEICVDVELGTLIRWSVGEELIENTEFFRFEGMWLPARIRHYINGKLRMEIEQKFSLVEGPIDWAALTPPNPTVLIACDRYLRPIVQSAPQPASAGLGPWYDVHVHGVIGKDGHVREASILPAGKPELEQQALRIVSEWVFSPASCDGRPTAVNANLVVHFAPQ